MRATYSPGEQKEYIRDLVYSFFVPCNNIITLPNLYFDLEERLINDGKHVECCEINEDVYSLQKQCVINNNIILHFGNILNLKHLNRFDGAFLDFCGCWNADTPSILNKLAFGSKIVITFQMRRESKNTQKLIDLNNREDSYVQLFAMFGIFITKYINYKDSTSPMCVFFGIKIIIN